MRMNLQRSHQIRRQESAMNGKGLTERPRSLSRVESRLQALSTKGRYFLRMFGNRAIFGHT